MQETGLNFPEIDQMRKDLAEDIHKTREERDQKRKQANSPINRIKKAAGFGPYDNLNMQADSLNELAKKQLESGKAELSIKTIDLHEEKKFDDYRACEAALGSLQKSLAINDDNIERMLEQLQSYSRVIEFNLREGNDNRFLSIVSDLVNVAHRAKINFLKETYNPEVIKSYKYAIDLIAENLDRMEGFPSSQALLEVINEVMDSLELRFPTETGSYSKKIEKIALENLESFLSEEKLDHNFFTENVIEYLTKIFRNKETKDAAADKLNGFLNNQKKFDSKIVQMLCLIAGGGGAAELSELALKYLSKILQSLHLNSDATIQRWRMDSVKYSSFWENLRAAQNLEMERPGICEFLQNNFGIYDFRRYPKDMLFDQVDQIENKSLPHGVMLMAAEDHNGAFATYKEKFERFYKNLRGKYAIRIYEVKNFFDLGRALTKTKAYGTKLSFAIIGGHGEPDSINFGNNVFMKPTSSYPTELNTNNLNGHSTEKITDMFNSDATIILLSCSTGSYEGIGQKLSEKFGLRVIAPEKVAVFAGIKTKELAPGHLHFDVAFDVNSKEYLAGNEITARQ